MLEMVNLFCQNYKVLLTAGVIMVSALIVLIGVLKPILFNKITCKPLRGFLLSFTNIALGFGFVAGAFWLKEISFDYYWFTATAFCVFSVFVYWCYENLTQARAGIHKLGSFVWKKIGIYIQHKVNKIVQGLNDVNDLNEVVESLLATPKKSTKKVDTKKKDDTKGL
jgi:hypothetical protein